MKTREQVNKEFDDKFSRMEIGYEEVKDFLHQTRLDDLKALGEMIKEENKWATEESPKEDNDKWNIHYEGYNEAIRNVLIFLSTLHTNLTMEWK